MIFIEGNKVGTQRAFRYATGDQMEVNVLIVIVLSLKGQLRIW